jgi:hypothetical protein
LEEAQNASDNALLSFPSIGRRTLAWARAQPVDTEAKMLKLDNDARIALAKLLKAQKGEDDYVTIGNVLALALDMASEHLGKVPHHREYDALYEFADNVRWEDSDIEEEE